MNPAPGDILRDGLWRRNPALIQLLGLCPLLAVTDTLIKGLGLGVATALVLLVSNLVASLAAPLLRREVRLVFFVLVIAGLVSSVDFLMNAWFPGLYAALGIFVPLIVSNCAILARAESFASRNRPLPAVLDGIAHGSGFAMALIGLGLFRELLGYGSLLRGAEQIFGEHAAGLALQLPGIQGFHLAALPPGAFFTLALLLALRNRLTRRGERRHASSAVAAETA